MKKIRVVQYGLGAMGSKMAEFVLKKEELELVAVIVRSEDKIGKDIGLRFITTDAKRNQNPRKESIHFYKRFG